MALSSTFEANFDQFLGECRKAALGLEAIEKQGDATQTSVTKLGGSTGKAGADFAKMTGGLRSVDASLNAVGVSIGKPIAAIEELSVVATKGVGALGALGTAGAILAGAIAAWDFGKWSAQFTGMNETWDRIYESWGMNALQAETLGAKQDLLAKASGIAKREITDLGEAVRITSQAVADNAAKTETAWSHQATWEREIRKHRAELPLIEAALKNHASTTAELSKEYGISARAIEYYVARKREQTAAEDEATKKAEAAATAQQRLRDSLFGTEMVTKAQEAIAAIGGIAGVTRMSTEAQAALNKTVGEAIESLQREGKVGTAALNELYVKTVAIPPVVNGLQGEWVNVGKQVTITADQVLADIKRMSDDTKAYEAETQRLADEWNQVKPPIDAAKQSVDETTGAAQQMTVAFQQSSSAIRLTASEIVAAGKAMDDAYRSAGFGGTQIATGGYQQSLRQMAGGDVSRAGAGQAWGNTLNVNVNNQDAQGIANKLVTEMRHQGVRF